MAYKKCMKSEPSRIKRMHMPAPGAGDEQLEAAFDLFVRKKQENVCIKYIAKAFAEAGIHLTNKQLNLVRAYVRGPDKQSGIPAVEPQQELEHLAEGINWDDKKDGVFRKIQDELDLSIQRFLLECPPKVASMLLKTLKRNFKAQRRLELNDRAAFEKNLLKAWDKPISLLEMLLIISRECGEIFNERNKERATKENDHVFYVLIRLHARACQIAGEIIALLKCGYADGAHARWRSLHEVAVTAMFIHNGGEEVACRYIAHDIVQRFKHMRGCKRYEKELKLDPITDQEFNSLEKQYAEAISKFGKGFESDYGWAIPALNGRNPDFSNIEAMAQMSQMRPYYRMASQNVHSNSRAILFRLGLPENSNLLLAGASMYGLAEPGQGAALSLMQATSALLFSSPSFQVFIEWHVISTLCNEVANSFVKIEKQHENHDQ